MRILFTIPDFLLAIISCWLGLSLLVQAPRDRLARAFAWFSLHLALYALTAFLPQLTSSPDAARVLDRLNIVETALVPPAFLQFILVLISPGRWTSIQRGVLIASYFGGVGLGLYALFGRLLPDIYPGNPATPYRLWSVWGETVVPPGLLTWLWVAQRLLPITFALWLLWRSYRMADADHEDRRLRGVFTLTSAVGVLGVLAIIAARLLDFPPSLGRGMITLAMIGLAYAVLAYRALLPPRVAQRTFLYSLLGSLITTLYVSLLLMLEQAVRLWLHIQAPVVSVFMLVILVAALGPVREWFRNLLDRRFYRREFDYGRLLNAIGEDLLERGDLSEQLRAALASICRTLGVHAGLVAVRTAAEPTNNSEPAETTVQIGYGPRLSQADALVAMPLPATPEVLDSASNGTSSYRLLLPLRRGGQGLGLLALGPKRSGQPFSTTEQTLLASLSSYLASAISYAQASQLQQSVLERLAEQSQALEAQRDELAQQATATALHEPIALEAAPNKSGLWVHALGPLYVERDGERIVRWGGEKAGTHQAEALFAFLFDRLGRGLTREEAEETIWPEYEDNIKKADDSFHRTLSALRRTLEPGLTRASESRAVQYHHERYWLDPGLIAWSDTDAFSAAAERGRTLLRQGAHEGALEALKYASDLYRGDYIDSGRFGDSFHAEERRGELQILYIEVLLALGSAYEVLGQVGEAATAYRRALQKSQDCRDATSMLQQRAEQGLARLQVVTS